MATVHRLNTKFQEVVESKFSGRLLYPDGRKLSFQEGKRHSETGPAIEHPNGENEWWLEGEKLSQEEWRERVQCHSPGATPLR